MNALDRVEAETWRRLDPPPRLDVSAWADEHRVLSPESSPAPGRWRTAVVPHVREIMDAIRDPQTETIVFLKSAQIAATESLINVLLYTLANDPGPSMYIMPTLELAAAFSKDRLMPAIRDCDVLRDQIGAPRSRDSDNSILRKGVAGAVLTISGANSPASLSSRPVRLLLADEIDRFPASVGAEGDPLSLAIKRTAAFRRRKILLASTPTVKGASRIEDWWEVSDKRQWHVPCPRCSEKFAIEWSHVRWMPGLPGTAHLECPLCQGRIEDRERPAMMAAGEWKATAPFSGVRGYRAWEIVAPWRRLSEIVTSFLVAKRNTETLRVWRNTCVAELWEEPGETVEPGSLILRREDYGGELPEGALVLTAGIDTQDDRLEALVVGWGPGEEGGPSSASVSRATPSAPTSGAISTSCSRSTGRARGAGPCGCSVRSWTPVGTARARCIAQSCHVSSAASSRPSVGAAASADSSSPRRSHCGRPGAGPCFAASSTSTRRRPSSTRGYGSRSPGPSSFTSRRRWIRRSSMS
jgi:phage terminase large subunit GpA-like protein